MRFDDNLDLGQRGEFISGDDRNDIKGTVEIRETADSTDESWRNWP